MAACGVQAITAAVLAGLSDIIAQKLAAKAPVNWRRTAAMAAFGGIWSGPSNHFWQARRRCLCLGDASLCTMSPVPGRADLDCFRLLSVQGFVERVFRGRSGPTLLIQKVRDVAAAAVVC